MVQSIWIIQTRLQYNITEIPFQVIFQNLPQICRQPIEIKTKKMENSTMGGGVGGVRRQTPSGKLRYFLPRKAAPIFGFSVCSVCYVFQKKIEGGIFKRSSVNDK